MPGYTDAQRRARNKYQSKKYIVCSAKLRKEDADALRAALEKDGQTVNGFLTACALDFIAAHAAPDHAAPKEE